MAASQLKEPCVHTSVFYGVDIQYSLFRHSGGGWGGLCGGNGLWNGRITIQKLFGLPAVSYIDAIAINFWAVVLGDTSSVPLQPLHDFQSGWDT